jgi:hypothetical protein
MAVDVEKIPRPIDNPMPPFPPKFMMLAGGEEMVIRQVTRQEIPDILPHIGPSAFDLALSNLLPSTRDTASIKSPAATWWTVCVAFAAAAWG